MAKSRHCLSQIMKTENLEEEYKIQKQMSKFTYSNNVNCILNNISLFNTSIYLQVLK